MKAVLGGGLGGLTAAYYLTRNAKQSVAVIEGSGRLGGWVKTTHLPNNIVFEHGPRTIRPKGVAGEATLSLVEELGLSEKVVPILRSHPTAKNRLIYVNGKLHTLPSSVGSLFFKTAPFTKPLITALLQDLSTPQKISNDESMYDFVSRRFGKEIAEYAIRPMICGICAGDAKEISVKFLMKSLFEAEQNHGSVFKGLLREFLASKKNNTKTSNHCALFNKSQKDKWSVWSLEGGLGLLPETLGQHLRGQGVEVALNSQCTSLGFTSSGTVHVGTSKKTYECKHLICSLPAAQLASLVKHDHPQLSAELQGIPTVSVGVVNLHYKGKVLKKDAFGFLVPPSENIPILGVIFDTCCFPKGDNTILTVMMGGKWFEEQFGDSPSSEYLLSIAVDQVRTVLGIHNCPESHSVSILRNCIPQYVIGHHDRVSRIRNYIKVHNLPLSIVGSSYDGVGVNDVILSSKNVVFT